VVVVGILDDPTDRHAVEILRRSIVMLGPGQDARIERGRALALLDELQRLQDEHRIVADELRGVIDRLQGVRRHPSAGAPPC
jgi:hypothetical protein